MLVCVTVGPFIIDAPALWDHKLQLFDVLKRGKSMSPEGVTPLRAAKHKSEAKINPESDLGSSFSLLCDIYLFAH